jgi:hypothetical protein
VCLVAVTFLGGTAARGQVLMMPDSTNNRLVYFSPVDGSVVNANAFALAAGTPVHAMQVGAEVWVSEQIGDRISRWDPTTGTSLGAVTGGLDNVRGMELIGTTIYLTNAGVANGAPGPAVVRFDTSGTNLGNFTTVGLAPSPFGVLDHPLGMLVSSSSANDDVHAFTLAGASAGTFHNTATLTFAEQMARATNGDILVAGFSSNNVVRLDPNTGTLISSFAASGARGVAQLGNGNILWTSGAGASVYDVVAGTSSSVYAGGGRYLDLLVPPPAGCEITCPADVTQANDAGVCAAVVSYPQPGTSGDCEPVVCAPASGSNFPVGTTTVTCSEQIPGAPPDGTGGPSCSFTVTVNDTEPPAIVAPADVTVGTDAGVCTAAVSWDPPTVGDNCGGVGAPQCVPPSGSNFVLGTTAVACSVMDAAGNVGNDGFDVTVNDDEPPTIVAPADLTVGTDAGACTAVVAFDPPTVGDNCAGVGAPQCVPPSGSTFDLGTTGVACTVVDAAGNGANDGFDVTVFDDEPPVLVCPSDIVEDLPPGEPNAVVNFPDPTVSDNCPGAGAPGCVPPSGSLFPAGTTAVVCSAVDAANLTGTCGFDVTLGVVSILEIPTLSGLGLAALVLLLAGFALVRLRRHA